MVTATPAREPIFNVPGAVVAAILSLVAIHAVRSLLSGVADFQILRDFAFFPAEWTAWLDPERVGAILSEAEQAPRPTETTALARYLVARGLHPWTILTYGVLHASWAHVLLNSVWLAAFGTPVVRRCGAGRFALIALLAVVGGALAQLLADPTAVMPVIGASAAVSGVMGAAAFFIFTPPYEQVQDASGSPIRARGTVRRLLGNRTALLFLGLWFITNLLFGLGAQPLGIFDGEIAWQAHIGGLVTGLIAFPILDPWHGGRPADDR